MTYLEPYQNILERFWTNLKLWRLLANRPIIFTYDDKSEASWSSLQYVSFELWKQVYYLEKRLYYYVSLQLIIFYLLCKCFLSTCHDYIKGLKVPNKDLWCCQVALCFILRVFDIDLFHSPWFIRNYILLQILKLWDFVDAFRNCEVKNKSFEYSDIFQNLIFYSTPIDQGAKYRFPWDSWALLRCKNIKWSFWPNTKKTLDTKLARI